MIQRIQTIWMFLAVLAAVFLFVASQDVIFFNYTFMMVPCIILGLIELLSIFSFKSRKRQILLNNISIIINVLLIGVLIYWLQNVSGGMKFPEKGIEPVFPVITIVCLVIANRYISKDEKLVKSVDRLR